MEKAQLEDILRRKHNELGLPGDMQFLACIMLLGSDELNNYVTSYEHDKMLAQILELLNWPDEEIVEYLIVDSEIDMEQMRSEVAKVVEQIQTPEDIAGDLLLNLLHSAMTARSYNFPYPYTD